MRLQDVELLNPWNGISAVGAARHYIARVQGQPANIGIFIDQTYDIGRVENVHWNPWFSSVPAYIEWQTTQGIGKARPDSACSLQPARRTWLCLRSLIP